MKVILTDLPEVLVLEPTLFGDERGFFMETYSRRAFNDAVGYVVDFVQDNHSRSARGVLRGLHYQLRPRAQGKLVRVTKGAVFDVVVDMRRSSAKFGKWLGLELSAENRRELWIPAGFAHGFLTLDDGTDVLYKTTDYYAPAAEASVRWDDPILAIRWPTRDITPIVSAKDNAALPLSSAPDAD